jgi:hypothetical protein
MALTALGLSGHPFHDPFHARRPYIPAMHTADLPMAAKARRLGMTLRHEQPVAG